MASSIVKLVFDIQGLEAQVILNRFTHGVTDADVAQIVKDKLWDGLKPQTSFECKLAEIRVGDETTGHTLQVNEAGFDGGAMSPVSNAYLITKVSPAGRNGRMFWPGVPELNVLATGRLTTAKQTALQNALDTAMAGFAVATPGPISLEVEHNTGVPGPVYGVVTSLIARPIIGTQRRRLR